MGKNRIKPFAFWIAILALMVLPACIKKHQAIQQGPGQNENLVQIPPEQVKNLLASQYPDRFKALHHAGLTLRGKTYVLKGYISVDRPQKSVRLVAQADMGGTLFQVNLKGEEVRIKSEAGFLAPRWLEPVAKDLSHLYLVPKNFNPMAARDHEGSPMVRDKTNEITREYGFEKCGESGFRPVVYREIKNRQQIYLLEYKYDKNQPHPSFVRIIDRETGYELNINIRYIFKAEGYGQ